MKSASRPSRPTPALARAQVQRYLGLVAEMDAHRPAGDSQPAPWKNRAEMYRQVLEQRHPTLLGKKRSGVR